MARRKTGSDTQQALFADDPAPAAAPTPAADAAADPTAVPAATCHRHWLDPRCGILASAADWLLAEARSASGNGRGRDDAASADGIVDLSAFTVVVPGRGAGHRLIEILLDKTALPGKSGGDRAARGGRLVPPQTVTLGTLRLATSHTWPDRIWQH